jgi:hypothetical protein
MWSDIKGKGVRLFRSMVKGVERVEMLPVESDHGAFVFIHSMPEPKKSYSEIFLIPTRRGVIHMIKRLRASGCTSPSFTAYD